MNFFGAPSKLPRSKKIVDKDGNILPEWRDALETLMQQNEESNLLVGASPARQTAEHLVAGTSSVAWDLSTAGQPKPYVPDGGISNAQLGDDIVITFAQLQNIATDTLIGRDTSGTGSPESISVTHGLEFTGSLSIGIADQGVTNARLVNMAAATIKGRASGAGTGVPTDLTGAQVATIIGQATTSADGVVMLATDAEVRAAATGANVVAASSLETASASVALTDAATVAVDWDAAINFSLTVTANRAIGNPTNGQPGTWRTILAQGNDASARTFTFGANFLGQIPTVTDCTSTKWYLFMIFCVSTSHFVISSKQAK